MTTPEPTASAFKKGYVFGIATVVMILVLVFIFRESQKVRAIRELECQIFGIDFSNCRDIYNNWVIYHQKELPPPFQP